DRAPEAHVFVWRAGVPVYPVDAEVFFGGRGSFDGDDVGLAGGDGVGNVEIVSAVRTGDLRGVGYSFAIDPEFATVIYSAKVQPDAIVFGRECGNIELLPIPPGAGIWAVGGHGKVREVVAHGIGGAGDLAEIVAKVGIGEDTGFDLCGEHGAGYGCFEPAASGEIDRRDCGALSGDLARGLKLPAFMKWGSSLGGDAKGEKN